MQSKTTSNFQLLPEIDSTILLFTAYALSYFGSFSYSYNTAKAKRIWWNMKVQFIWSLPVSSKFYFHVGSRLIWYFTDTFFLVI